MSGRRGKQSKSAAAPALDRRPPWVVVYAAGAGGSSPALTFLDACPGKVDAEFGAVLDAVAGAPPPAFSDLRAHPRNAATSLSSPSSRSPSARGRRTRSSSKLESGTHIPTIPVLARIIAVLDERLLIGIERDTADGEAGREIAAVAQLVTA